MRILKFGGSSVATPERVQKVREIVQARRQSDERLVIVCSAFGGVTDDLLATAKLAAACDESYLTKLDALKERHLEAAKLGLTSPGDVGRLLEELTDVLRGVYLLRECSTRTLDLVMSFGERLSCTILAALLHDHVPETTFLDTREVIVTDDHFGAARVDFGKTRERLCTHAAIASPLCVATGFIASSFDGQTTTLGRGGSDYTASILGALLQAEVIEIWTDVSGIFTADPRKVPTAFPVHEMTYEEAMELSHFGAKVIYFPTMQPAMDVGIPILIKNTFAPDDPETKIQRTASENGFPIKGISSIDEVALVRVQGGGMIGICGIAARLFGALARAQVNAILITQGSSEHSICVAVAPEAAARAQEAIDTEFTLERQRHLIDSVVVETDVSIIAIVGERMRNTPGIGGQLFGALGAACVNVIAVAQGSSERNISIVVSESDLTRALQTIHDKFFLCERTAHVCLVGVGGVGKELLNQITKLPHRRHTPTIKLVGLVNTKQMLLNQGGIPLSSALQDFAAATTPRDLSALLPLLEPMARSGERVVIVDCTASDEIVDRYADLLRAGISVITSNKRAMSGPQERVQEIRRAQMQSHAKFCYETNVGAGLPVLKTIQGMLATGDRISRIDGVLSGTMSYLFNSLQPGQSFRELVAEAKTKGYTEPDPREDLSGLDVARKLTVLARETGWSCELSEVQVESLADETDEQMNARLQSASAQGAALRYLASLDEQGARVSLTAVAKNHPAYHLQGTENMIAITSDRYATVPLVIRGPGAGVTVTAAGLLEELLSL